MKKIKLEQIKTEITKWKQNMKKQMIKQVIAAFFLCGVAGFAQAESLDGSRVLEQEAQRAQELQRLQHQAEVLKQRAEITRYLDEIEKNGGDLSDLEQQGVDVTNLPRRRTPSSHVPAASPAPAAASSGLPAASFAPDTDAMPRLLRVEAGRAAFATRQGTLYASVGNTLPGGYKVLDLNLRDGALLQKGGMQYRIDVSW